MSTARMPGRAHQPASVRTRIDQVEADFEREWRACEMDSAVAPRIDGSLPEVAQDHTGRGTTWQCLAVIVLCFWAYVALVIAGRLL